MDSRVVAQIHKALVEYEESLPSSPMIRWSGVDPQEALLVAYLERVLTLAARSGKSDEARTVLAIALEDLVEL